MGKVEKEILGDSMKLNLNVSKNKIGAGNISSDIGINALPPNLKRTGPYYIREFDHYEAIPGKFLGIRPGENLTDWARLKSVWGFTGIKVNPANYRKAIAANFNWKDIMVDVGPNNYIEVIDSLLAGSYYSDEPFHENCDPSDWVNPEWEGKLYLLSQIRAYANQHGAKYVISHYFDCDHVLEYFNDVDVLMYSGYKKHTMVTSECFVSLGEDQRDTWTRWRNQFPDHFTRVWISTGITDPGNDNDDNEFQQLLEHAVYLGFRDYGQVWLYTGNSATEENLANFCYWAWKYGWLRRFEKVTEYYIWWRCVDPGGCDPDDPSGWEIYFYEIVDSWIEEVTP